MSNKTKQTRPTNYTLEFKQDAAKLVLQNSYTRQRAADHLGVSLSAISRWVIAEKDTEDAGKKDSALNLTGHDELIWLRKENEQLRMEREILNFYIDGWGGLYYSSNAKYMIVLLDERENDVRGKTAI